MNRITYKQTENPVFVENIDWSPIEDFSTGVDIGDIDIVGVKPLFRPEQADKPAEETTSTEETTPSKRETATQTPVVETSQPEDKSNSKSKRYTDKNEFIKDLSESYIKALRKKGINESYAKMLVAQDALETGWGKYYKGNWNFGNIIVPKGSNVSGTEGKDHDSNGNLTTQKFRNFDSLDEYTDYKVSLLNGSRYKAFSGNADPNSFYTRIKNGGYAADPDYVQKLVRVYNSSILSSRNGGTVPSKYDALINKLFH